ncbi:MAG: sigma-70 family RNA polymerase sigma factor [Acidobacteria bacterium]|uniref:RNA polymerase sigma factor n=1 Tax=Candidatus Sulfomarinibacter kjeldsenii TaxID=2885994 RepID=A0A8J6XW08_9BACT|nr:sigma-70 family RNA polymerase sigma factor [Candidatus Sulfomarinibacter kjeldsenii]MBD3857853.1 sigma-70 family RNA polymerase sigma factor [Candidatus Sulfomarinibacter kjeldsenii]MBD3869772.1 sigma-70 family RNA polymerase sigma factor [Candidatus Sulfomarinibacter kjeldsenii]
MSRRGGSAPDAGVTTLRRYLKEIGRYSPLNHEQEVELAARIQAGDEDAVREMVESNLRFVVAYAKRYRNPNVPFLDLIHEGNLGLIQAAKKYDPSQEGHDVKFITYAVWWIRQAILHALAEHAGSFRLPQKQANTLYRMERIRSLLAERFARAPTDNELSEELGISVDDVRVLTRASRSSLSLNEPVDSEGDSELGDLLEQTGLPDTDELLLRESFSRALSDALAELPARERKVLELRFGLYDDQPKTLREIGEVMGLSRERVRQIESRALNKLRRSHQKHSLQGFLR